MGDKRTGKKKKKAKTIVKETPDSGDQTPFLMPKKHGTRKK